VSRDEATRLTDILGATEVILSYAARDADLDDSLVQDAILFRLTVIGEAVKKLSAVTCAQEPGIDWSAWAGLRDVIAHSYFRVDMQLIQNIVATGVPELAAAVGRLLHR
jgi:uncharacterized protein with HEPN domain